MKHLRNILNINIHWATIFFIFSLLISGCATTAHRALKPELANQTYQIKVQSIIRNEEITIQFDEKQYTSTGYGGLFWAFVDDKKLNQMRSKAIKSLIAPLLKAKTKINFRTQYWKQLEKTLAKSPWLKIQHLEKSTVEYTPAEMAKVKPPLLILNTSYELTPNCQILAVQTKAQLYLNDLSNPDYFGYHYYYSDKIGSVAENEKAIKLWTANNALIYRKALAEGIEQNMRMLQLELFGKPAEPKTENGEEIQLQIRTPISGWTLLVKGRILKGDKNRFIMREKRKGHLFSIATGLQD